MQEDNNYKVRLGIVLLLSIIASILMVIFTVPKANALVMVYPTKNTTISGTKYYGYDIPTRPNASEFGTGLKLGTTARLYNGALTNDFSQLGNSLYGFGKSNNFHFDLLDNYVNDNNISLNGISYNMTNPISVNGPSDPVLLNLTYTFNMGQSGGVSEMMSSGQYFDYKQYYSFEYDIVLFDSNTDQGHLGQYVNLGSTPTRPAQSTNFNGLLSGDYLRYTTIGMCTQYPENYPTLWTCGTGNAGYSYRTSTIYQDRNLQVIKVYVDFSSSGKFRFSEDLNYSNSDNGATAFTGVNQSLNGNMLGVNYFNISNGVLNKSFVSLSERYTYLMVSMPYNITLWTTEPSEFCQGNSCWTQSDTDSLDNNKQTNGSGSFLDDILGGINGILNNDYGFSGIVNFTFGFINDLLTSMRGNTTCYVASVKFFNKNIVIPCGVSFWNRSDMTAFNTTYNLIFIGALSYILCWKIYKDLLNVINPSSRVVNGSEVDSL